MEYLYIRPLMESDALVSWRWRNNPEIWKYTGSHPNMEVTPEVELGWIRKAILDPSTIRFAICVHHITDISYIGNVHLSEVDYQKSSAVFNIFIGDRTVWGKGYGTQATHLILMYAKDILKLKKIYLSVRKENTAAVRKNLAEIERILDGGEFSQSWTNS